MHTFLYHPEVVKAKKRRFYLGGYTCHQPSWRHRRQSSFQWPWRMRLCTQREHVRVFLYVRPNKHMSQTMPSALSPSTYSVSVMEFHVLGFATNLCDSTSHTHPPSGSRACVGTDTYGTSMNSAREFRTDTIHLPNQPPPFIATNRTSR